MKLNIEGKRIFAITLLVVIISFLHYVTSIQSPHLHAIYARAYYIPIILAAFWYSLRGGIVVSAVVGLIYLPHVIFQWGGGLGNLSRFLEIVMFIVGGLLTGLMVELVVEQRNKYQKNAQELVRSYEKLRGQTEKLLEMEDHLRTSDRLAVMGELSASLAHEVRNPLGSIRGTVDILRKEFPAGGKHMEFFKILVQEVNRLNEVVERYLGLAKQKRQKMVEKNLCDIVQSVVDLVSAKARKEKIDLIVVKPAETITVFTDETLLQQVLLNILLNAMASMEEGGRILISPSLKREAPKAGTSPHPYASVTVSDTGKGIKEAEIDNVFKPFYTTKAEGTGLGLAIAKRSLQQLGGEIGLESKEGAGTLVTITLPSAEGKRKNLWDQS
ncbi:MAG: sensor histidine kinase [Gemmatimonadota bacterium]|nr:MAG: sensor histidine kinase [Gemmatimonadota bacterium]